MKEEPCKHVEGVDTGKRIRKNLLNIGVFIAEILILVLLGPWAVRFFLPLLVGWLIAQIANPLVRFLEQHLHIVRKHSSMGIIAGAILLIVWICYLIVTWTAGRVVFLLEHLPEYYRSLSAEMTVISDNLESLAGHLSPEAGQKIGELTGSLSTQIGTIVGSLGGVTMGVAGNAAGKIPSLLISFLFVLLFAYFFTAQSERVQDFIKIIVPEETRRQLQLIGKKMKFAVGGYFRAQFKIMFIVFVILTAGLLILRVPYAVLAAAGIAVLDFLPMLGTGTILIPWAVLWALSGKLSSAAGLVILYAVTQVTRQLIQPKMVGDSIGMDAMTTLIFLFIGYRMAGLIGMIVAIPSGLILIQLYEAGAFAGVIASVRELADDMHRLRTEK